MPREIAITLLSLAAACVLAFGIAVIVASHSPANIASDALAHNSMNSARPALYLAPARLHSDPLITVSPPGPQTDHFHRPRPRAA